MITLFGNIKGGVGKSTLACNIASALALREAGSVLLIDGDKQGSSADFVQSRTEHLGDAGFSCMRAQGKEVRSQALSMKDKFKHIIIDAGGQDNPSLRAGLTVADQILIPVAPRSFETWALEGISELIDESSITNPNLKAFAVINLGFSRGVDNEQTQKIIEEDFPLLTLVKTSIVQRKIFSDSVGQGLSVLEGKPKNSDAITELENLLKSLKL